MSLLWFPASYSKVQRALQWWQERQSKQLWSEAETIRNGLLQESFTIRRSMERSLLDEDSASTEASQAWLKKIETFHHALEELSDRLSPIYIEHSLPLAIQCTVELWRTRHPKLNIETQLPATWRQEPLDRSIVILKMLDELLRITSSERLTGLSIHLSLEQQGILSELVVQISYPNVPALTSHWGLEDLDYLRQTFEFLISGRCFRRRKALAVAWHFQWFPQYRSISYENRE